MPQPDEKPTKMMLVAWALGESGGNRDFVDKLDVAVFAFNAYSTYFGYAKYPQYPDVDSVRVALDVLKVGEDEKAAKGLRLHGNEAYSESAKFEGITKWRLTESGIKWWMENRDWVRAWVEKNSSSSYGTARPTRGQVSTESDAKSAMVKRVRATPGFEKWVRDPSASRHQIGLQSFFTAYGIGPRTERPDYLREREKVLAACSADAQVITFLQALDKQFGDDYRRILTGEVKI